MFDLFAPWKYNTDMQAEHIVMIIIGALFIVLFVVFLILYFRRKKSEAERKAEMENMFSDKNLAKMDYDCAVYDEETEKLLAQRKQSEGQMTIDDVMNAVGEESIEEPVFQTVAKEGMEEIKGNYKPD